MSLVYALFIVTLAKFYSFKPAGLGCKVISIGNITWGGTGKTPLVEAVVKALKADNRNPAVLTRGYKKKPSANAQDARSDVRSMGDEPYMLSQKLPGTAVIVNKDRIKAGLQAVKAHRADTVVLDDGLQQWRIKKDLEIVAIDVGNPFGNGWLIPRGILREPLRALKRADIFVLTNADTAGDLAGLESRLSVINPSALIVRSELVPVRLYGLNDREKDYTHELQQGKPVGLLCAIGNPGSFRRAVERMDIKAAQRFFFRDHHAYTYKDIQAIADKTRQCNIEYVITTEKDADKLRPLVQMLKTPQFLVLEVALKIVNNESEFNNRLRGLYTA
ncbi:MAG: tetraacyldisaccharide 4'-kinase [Candidatus Omnitrophica bacterium]|nr:tetraacyldisaccharide 4'-kinase [Candidatus Omnitrophota bacterium]